MLTTRFCHYFPSGAFVCDELDTKEFQYQPKETEATIKKLYRLKILLDIPISSNEEESLDTVMETEEFKLGLSHLPSMIWTPTKYKPSQMVEFISFILNHNFKVSKAVLKARIEPKST
jgi:hypothetical protein